MGVETVRGTIYMGPLVATQKPGITNKRQFSEFFWYHTRMRMHRRLNQNTCYGPVHYYWVGTRGGFCSVRVTIYMYTSWVPPPPMHVNPKYSFENAAPPNFSISDSKSTTGGRKIRKTYGVFVRGGGGVI
jgi:hypothetical protein